MKFSLGQIVPVVFLASLPLMAHLLIYKPRNAQNAQMVNEITAKQEKLRALNRVTATIGDLQEEIASRREAIAYFQKKLPSEKEIDKVIQEIWRLAEANKLTTKSIRTLNKTSKTASGSVAGTREQPVVVQLEGAFKGFYTFLQALENQPRIMRIEKLTLATDEKENNGRIEATFEMSVFFEQESNSKKCPPKS